MEVGYTPRITGSLWKLSESESEVAQSCPTLCDPMDCILPGSSLHGPGSSLHGILQASVLEWVAISFSRGSSQPRDQTQVSCIPGRCFNLWATREAEWPPANSQQGNGTSVLWLQGTEFSHNCVNLEEYLVRSATGQRPDFIYMTSAKSQSCYAQAAPVSGQQFVAGFQCSNRKTKETSPRLSLDCFPSLLRLYGHTFLLGLSFGPPSESVFVQVFTCRIYTFVVSCELLMNYLLNSSLP